ncbi:hypothetical protein D3C72_178190 [compost metagenome]
MTICDNDLKILVQLISTFITATVALYIFFNWKKQKGTEVIANESKEAIKELLDMVYIASKLEGYKYHQEDLSQIKNHLEKFSTTGDLVIKRLYFINQSIDVKKLKDSIDNYQLNEIGLINHHDKCIKDPFLRPNLSSTNKQKNTASKNIYFTQFIINADIIISLLQPYSTYRSTPKFK